MSALPEILRAGVQRDALDTAGGDDESKSLIEKLKMHREVLENLCELDGF